MAVNKNNLTASEKSNAVRLFLTTCYPTYTTGTHGVGGNKSVKEDVVLSRKG